jgi:hypothetical protein
MEGEVLFTSLLRRCPRIEGRDPEPQWRGSFTLRGLEQLNLRLG